MSKPTALLATGLLTMGLAGGALSQTINTTPTYDCNTLYSANTTDVFRFNDPAVSAATTQMYRIAGGGTEPASTIALGYRYGMSANRIPLDQNGNEDPNQKLIVYHWYWGQNADTINVREVESGSSTVTTKQMPGNRLPSASRYWSGGEVDQRTGRILFTGGEGSTLNTRPDANSNATATGSYSMMLYDPVTGTMNRSGTSIRPATESDVIRAPNNVLLDHRVASDVAVDTEGNAYIIVGRTSTATNGNRRWLMRIVPGQDSTDGSYSGWRYNKVVEITGISADPLWGMAFLNGTLYAKASVNTANAGVYAINVFSGVATALSGTSAGQYDLAACQVAPVIRGVVRNDPAGNGTGEGVRGIRVDIYKEEGGQTVYKGSRATDGSGNYSFIVDSWADTYYLRVRQPKIGGDTYGTNNSTTNFDNGVNLGGINAAQTWVGVGGDLNKSSALCYDEAGHSQWINASGACKGARRFGSDPAGPATMGTAWNIEDQAQYLAKVVMASDMEVAYVDFGISVEASYGDASDWAGTGISSGFRVLRAQGGPVHVTAHKNLWLGDTVASYSDGVADINSNAHPSDDGIFIQRGGAWIPFQGVALANARTYRLKAIVNGALAQQGYLNVSDNTGTGFVMVQKNADLKDTANTGEIEFDYNSRNSQGAPTPIITRFRFSTTPSLPGQGAVNTTGAGQQAWGSTSTTAPWVVDGEVEDYQTYQSTSMIHVAAISQGGTGTFNYTFGNITDSFGSSTTGTLTTTAPNVRVDESPYPSDNTLHAVANWGQSVTITQTMPAPTDKWELLSVQCMDSITGVAIQNVGVVLGTGAVTIPGAATGLGGDIVCLFTNKRNLADPARSSLTVTPNGPVYITNSSGYTPTSYTAVVTANDSSGNPQRDVDIVLTTGGVSALTQGATGTFTPGTGICRTDTSGTCTVIWTSVGHGTYDINATLDGDNIGAYYVGGNASNLNVENCSPGGMGNNQCSPQRRVFQSLPDPTLSTLMVSPAGPVGTTYFATNNAYTVTVTAMNSFGTLPNVPIILSVDGGTLAGLGGVYTCTTNTAGACTVTWTSATPSPSTGYTVTATLNGAPITGSSQSRVFYDEPSCTHSALTVNPETLMANGTSTSTVTATLRDASGNLVLAPTVVSFSLPTSVYNYGSLSTTQCTTSAITGECSVMYTAPNAIPTGATHATVTAALPCGNKAVDIGLTQGERQIITVNKAVIGTGYVTAPAPAEFTVSVSCSLAGATHSKEMKLAHNGEDSITVPVGAICVVTEVDPIPGGGVIEANHTNFATIAPSNFTVVRGQNEIVEIENEIIAGTHPKGVLRVSKYVSGNAADVNAGHDASNEFEIYVDCTGDLIGRDPSFLLKDGAGASVEAVLGSECNISEPGVGATPQIPQANSGYQYSSNIVPNDIAALPVSLDVSVTNRVSTAGTAHYKLTVKNVVAGHTDQYNPTNTFTLNLQCLAATTPVTLLANNTAELSVTQGSSCIVDTTARPGIVNGMLYQWGTTTYELTPDAITPPNTFTMNSNETLVATHPIIRTQLRTVTVTKTVTGAGYTGQPFHITLNCGAGFTWENVLITPSTPVIRDVPVGRACTVTETNPSATVIGANNTNFATIEPNRFTVRDFHAAIDVTVTNEIRSGSNFNKATLRVIKDVTGADKVAGHIDGNTFGIVVDCPSMLAPEEFSLEDGQSATIQGIVGEQCTISEPAAGIPPAKLGYQYASNNTGTVTLLADNGNEPGVSLTIENMVVPDSVTLYTVTVTNALAHDSLNEYNVAQPFVLSMNCGAPYIWEGAKVISATIGDKREYSVLAGSECTMSTENRPATNAGFKWDLSHGTNGTIYSLTSPFFMNAAVTQTATHRIIPSETRNIVMTKTVTGEAYAGAFRISMICDDGGNRAPVDLAHGESHTFQAMDGTYCEAFEEEANIGAGNGYTARIVPSGFTVTEDMTVSVTNHIEGREVNKAWVHVTKEVTGATSQHPDSNRFEIHVNCVGTEPDTLRLLAGQTASIQGEVDQICTITEPGADQTPQLPSARAGYYYAPSISPSRTPLSVGGIDVTVTNRIVSDGIAMRKLFLTNAVTGEPTGGAYNRADPFVLTFDCGTGYNFDEVVLLTGARSEYSVPLNARCLTDTVRTKLPGITDTNYRWHEDYYSQGADFIVTEGVTQTVTHSMIAVTMRQITVTKNVVGATGAYSGKFDITLNCGGVYKWDISLAAGESSSDHWAPDGSTCSVFEDEPTIAGHTNFVEIVPDGFPVNQQPQTVTVTNRIVPGTHDVGDLYVRKTVTDTTTLHNEQTVFEIVVACGTETRTFPLKDGHRGRYQGLVGQDCTITEPNPPPLGGGYRYVANISPHTTAIGTEEQTVVVENEVVTDDYRVVNLRNLVNGAASAYDNEDYFELTLSCPGVPDWTRTVDNMRVGNTSLFNVPDNRTCTVTVDSRPAILDPTRYTWRPEMTSYSADNPFQVNATTAPVINNVTHFVMGVEMRTITVRKSVTGNTSGGSGQFTIHVSCENSGGSYAKTMTLGHNGNDTLQAPLGATCSVTENNPGADVIGVNRTNTAVIWPSDFDVDGDQTVRVANRIENRDFPKGTLIVSKTISGEAADIAAAHDPDALFGILVACATTDQADFQLKGGQSASVEGEVGQACVIDEAATPTLDPLNYEYAWGISPMETTLRVAGEVVEVSVDNKVVPSGISRHGVSLTNVVGGPAPTAYNAITGRFVLNLNCGTGYTWITVPMRAGDKAGYSVPDNISCTTGVDSRPAPNASHEWRDDRTDYSLGRTFTTLSVDEDGTVTHWLQRADQEQVTIVKTLIDGFGLYQSGTIDVTLACTDGTNKTFPFAPTGAQTEMVSRDAQCTVTSDLSSVVLSGGTPRKSIAPALFIVPSGGRTVEVETELLNDPVVMAVLTVEKKVTGILAGHVSANKFTITALCAGTSAEVKTFGLYDGETAATEAEIGDTCVVEEPTVPTTTPPYMYAPTVAQSLQMVEDRRATVINEVMGINTTRTITFVQATVADIAGSGYVSGLLNTTMNCGAGRVYNLSLAEGDSYEVIVPQGTSCTAATMGGLPPLNNGFLYNGPTTSPTLPYAANNGILTINYAIVLARGTTEVTPIPTLDMKALLLLTGLLSGLMFWQVRRPKRQRVDW
ncbi:MAG: DUF5979 domain-containing protein [Burkholderiales bacterium]|nr:DUF5979 domain-containing protein [Burkholderiales bacterium]